jgi:transposase
MRLYTKQHPFSCGLALHARPMDLCLLPQEGEMLVHRHMPAGPDPFLKTLAPDRETLVVGVACLCPWSGLADLCARAGMPFVRGHALSMQAMHGGKANNDTSDAQQLVVLLRGGMLPQAYVYPAEMRATRDVLRRRRHCMRQRAEFLAHIEQTTSQDTLPEIGKQMAYTANRDGVAARFPAPAVQKSMAVARARIGHYDPLRRDVALSMGRTAKHHDANTRSRLRPVPGIGAILRLVLLYAIHDLQRFPRVQDVVSYCRLVKWAQASAGKRSGTVGTTSGQASLTWACSAAALLCLRQNPPGQQYRTRVEPKHGKGKA